VGRRPSTRFCLIATLRARDATTIFDDRLIALRHGTSSGTRAPCAAPFTPDRRHVLTIPAHRLTTFAPGNARLIGGPFVRGALLMRSSPAFAGDFSLPRTIHGRKPAVTGTPACLGTPTSRFHLLASLGVGADPIRHSSSLSATDRFDWCP
jgi:hypothetical protein